MSMSRLPRPGRASTLDDFAEIAEAPAALDG